MRIFSIIAGMASILSLILSIIAIKKVITIENNYIDKSRKKIKQQVKAKSIFGSKINQTGIENND